jgi:hypothetical protein
MSDSNESVKREWRSTGTTRHQDEDVVVSVRKRPLSTTVGGPSTKIRKNEADDYCVLSTCSSTDRRARRHALAKHLPVVFKDAIGVTQLSKH